MDVFKQNHIRYGLIMCVIVMVCLILMELSGQNQSFEKSPFISFATMIAPLFVWYFGIRSKKKMQKGKLTYKEGVLEGFKISLVFAVLSPFIFLFYYLAINPGIVASVKEIYHMKDAADSLVITIDLLVQFVSAIIFGTLYGAVLSLFLRSKKK